MVIKFSKKANDLFDLVRPYIDLKAFPAKLKDDTPEEICKAYDEWQKLAKEEKQQYLEAMGLI